MTDLKPCPFCGCDMKIEAVTIDYIETALLVGNPRHKDGCMIDEDIRAFVKAQPAADVAPVVRCKDCKHSWEDIGGLCCSHGACVDLTVPGDFYCAYGERAEVTTICQSCGAMMDGESCTPSK